MIIPIFTHSENMKTIVLQRKCLKTELKHKNMEDVILFLHGKYFCCKRTAYVLSILFLMITLTVSCSRPLLEVDASRGNAFPAVVYSDPSDGYARSTYASSTSTFLRVGDIENNEYDRAFLKFSLAGISGTLSSARLHVYVFASYKDGTLYTTSPLRNPGLGDCVVRHIADFGTVDTGDIDAPSIGNDPGVLIGGTTNPNVGYVSVDVTAAMQDDINNGRAWSVFMIKMSTDTDGNTDRDEFLFYSSEETGTDRDPFIGYAMIIYHILHDQVNDVARSAGANVGDWGQSFIPTKNRLARIDLALDSVGNINTYHVTVNVRSTWGGTIVGSAVVDVPPGVRNDDVGEFTSFIFATPLRLIPGTQYIIEVNLGLYYHQAGTTDKISWYCASGDTYPNGRAIQEGHFRSDDMIFRTFGITAADFTLSASPPALTITAGSLRTSTITVASISGFSSPVALSYSWLGATPSGVTVTLPGPVMPPPDGSTTSELQVFASSTATIGTFTLRITGSSGTLSSNIDVSIQVARATPTPGCIIATATYGSPFAPEVLYMRHVRDNLIGSNQVGRQIVSGLNAFYYSWSPPIANFIDTHREIKPIFQILLLPFLGITHMTETIYIAVAAINTSLASIAATLFAAASTATIYALTPVIAFRSIYRKIHKPCINSK